MTEVYWNLHKHCFSVRERGRVIRHTDHVTLRNAHFVVQRSGYERTVREKVRCVQAWVRGEVTEASEGLSGPTAFVTYNPYRADHFQVRATGERIDSAPLVAFSIAGGKPVVAIQRRDLWHSTTSRA
jgi:hypothetical protein